jgi:hypothetical protein
VAGVPEEPATLKEAMRDPRWVKALREEYDAMERNGVWSAFSGVPPERLTVGLTTKFKVKLLPDGKLDKLKARISWRKASPGVRRPSARRARARRC